ncbi:TetR/AcrR family transcriptional regulator [Nocardioides rubriscoriae]|uniref:TetR/AcrR family transcriptional regulator n=1 Tax=Nocardioides rubriscoriae TaxID=642762 RepID=UPI0011DF27CA|nr:TetR/AcrR family transcriptional regulator [Nocardioides rubriscoriae]
MGRPRAHDLDTLLDHARTLWVEQGLAGVTIRALSAASGASNGAIYNAFGSRDNLLVRVWVREAEGFLAFQVESVEAALALGDPRSAVVAAALAPSDYSRREPAGSRLLLTVAVDDLAAAGADVGDAERRQVRQLRRRLDDLIVRLADEVWHSRRPPATTMVKACVVDLPSALLPVGDHLTDPLARTTLERAVRGVLADPPSDPQPGPA